MKIKYENWILYLLFLSIVVLSILAVRGLVRYLVYEMIAPATADFSSLSYFN